MSDVFDITSDAADALWGLRYLEYLSCEDITQFIALDEWSAEKVALTLVRQHDRNWTQRFGAWCSVAESADELLHGVWERRGNWHDPNNLADLRLQKLVLRGFISCSRIQLPELPDEWAEARVRDTFKEGGLEHRQLCARAALWLEGQGKTWTLDNRRYEGGLSDLMSGDRTLVVEAGNTASSRILAAVGNGRQLLHAPFRWVYDSPARLYARVLPFSLPGTVRQSFQTFVEEQPEAASALRNRLRCLPLPP